jgi:hypothetical protein
MPGYQRRLKWKVGDRIGVISLVGPLTLVAAVSTKLRSSRYHHQDCAWGQNFGNKINRKKMRVT